MIRKGVIWVSERYFDEIATDISEEARMQLWEVWRDDLSTDYSPAQLVAYANGLLAYFGSDRRVCSVGFDTTGECFSWKLLKPC